MKRKLFALFLAVLMVGSLMLTACGPGDGGKGTGSQPKTSGTTTKSTETEKKTETEKATEATGGTQAGAPSPTDPDAAGFDEIPMGDPVISGALEIGGVYFQPVDMEPAGNSLSKDEADCHVEADISATEEGAKLGFGKGDFVPYLKVKCFIQKKGSDKVQEIAFMPMNASDGPHYGANIKWGEGVGVYHVKYEISAPGNEYLLHVDKETGVDGRFWTEPIIAEWDVEWTGPRW